MMGDVDPKTSGAELDRLGPYATAQVIGSGGMGTVYEARHPTLGKRVALKVIKGTLAGDRVARERFMREARAIALVSHPHVVDVFDVGIEDGRAFIVMELLEGETLEALLARKGGRLGVTQAADLLLPVISATAAIHDTGVVHRDLKPGNVMLARRGRFAVEPVVLDFGISRGAETASGAEGLTEPHMLIGTLPYQAPEQLRDARAAGPQSDQYAVGVMLFECVTGRKPFTGADRYELIHAAMTAEITAPSRLNPELSPSLDEIVRRALARRPEARFPSMRAFGSALLSVADRPAWKRWAAEFAGVDPAGSDAGLNETAPDAPRPAATAPQGSRRRVVWLVATGAALAAATAMALTVRGGAPARRVPVVAPAPASMTDQLTRPAAPAPVSTRDEPTPAPAIATPRVPVPAATVGPTRADAASVRRKRHAPAPVARTPSAAPAAVDPLTSNDASSPSADAPRNSGKPASNAQADDAIDPFSPVR